MRKKKSHKKGYSKKNTYCILRAPTKQNHEPKWWGRESIIYKFSLKNPHLYQCNYPLPIFLLGQQQHVVTFPSSDDIRLREFLVICVLFSCCISRTVLSIYFFPPLLHKKTLLHFCCVRSYPPNKKNYDDMAPPNIISSSSSSCVCACCLFSGYIKLFTLLCQPNFRRRVKKATSKKERKKDMQRKTNPNKGCLYLA